jgi:hypothetical protein
MLEGRILLRDQSLMREVHLRLRALRVLALRMLLHTIDTCIQQQQMIVLH